MPLTILDIATDLDSHVIYANSGRTAAQTAYLVNSINAGLEDLRAHSPQSFRQTVEIVWKAPIGITTTVSGASMGPSDSFAGYNPGCTLNIAGDATFNELAAAGDGSTAATAIFADTGTPGSKLVTLWGDCIKLGATVDHVVGGSLLHERRPLEVLASRNEWLAFQRFNGVYPYDYGFGSIGVQPTINRQPGVPRGIWLETVLNGNEIEYRARCAPLPNQDYRATLEVQGIADSITAADVAVSAAYPVTVAGTLTPSLAGNYSLVGVDANGNNVYAGGSPQTGLLQYLNNSQWVLSDAAFGFTWNLAGPNNDPSGTYAVLSGASGVPVVTLNAAAPTTTRPVPGNRIYTILRALCLYHWSSAPWFRNQQALAGIQQGYTNAIEQLRGFRNNAAVAPISRVQY